MRRLFEIILMTFVIILSGGHMKVQAAPDKKFTVVIDAGHGGKDIGATDNGVMEKNINLKVAKQLESLIKKKLKNTNVVMTRTDDSFLTLQQRADKANKAKGDIFISIHTNSVDKKNKNRRNLAGSSVYTLGLHKDENNLEVAMRENSVIELESDYEQKYSGFNPQSDESYIIFEMAQKKNLSQSIKFAENIEKELVNAGRENRGVHQAGFWVLWATSMPSVLIELDFICNPTSAKYLDSDKGAKELANAIFKAIQKYESTWRRNNRIVSSGLSDTYVEGDIGNLEETYTADVSVPYTTAKTRTHKSAAPTAPIKNSKNGERRRRSSRSRELSVNKSFEESSLVYPSGNLIAGVTAAGEENVSLTENAEVNKTSGKNKGKKDKNSQKQKKEEKKKEKKRKSDAHNAKVNKLVTVYKIQILASSELLNQGNSRFCGLSPVSAYKENNLYKYYYGESTDRNEIESMLREVKKKIPDAFIVAGRKSAEKSK